MGGQVALGFRFESGETVCYDTHTNHLPDWLKCKEILYDRSEKHIRDYIIEARKEYSDSFEDVPVAPQGYGLVFYDLAAGKIHSRQNYFSPTHFVDIDITAGRERREKIRAMSAYGRLEVSYFDRSIDTYSDQHVSIKDESEFDEFARIFQEQLNRYYSAVRLGENADRPACFIFVNPVLSYNDYDKENTWMNYRNHLTSDGVVIDAEARRLWDREERDLSL